MPGIIYGKDNENNVLKRLIVVRDKDLRRELRVRGTTFENTLFELSIVKLDGLDHKNCSTIEVKPYEESQVIEKFVVVPRQTQLNPGDTHYITITVWQDNHFEFMVTYYSLPNI